MNLVKTSEFQKAIGLNKFGIIGSIISNLLMKILRISKVNQVYNLTKNVPKEDFCSELLKTLDVSISYHKEDLDRIPLNSPFIVVSNHPLGALDGIIMIKLLSSVRSDFKVMGNFLLKKIEPIEDKVIAVNPFEDRKDAYSSLSGMKQALEHLSKGGCLGIFPAGEVSHRDKSTGNIEDIQWQNTALKLIKKSNVPVVPMYFHAKNSELFYRLSNLHPILQTALLPSEMMRKRVKPIKLRIGKPILQKQIVNFKSNEELGKFLRTKVYMMKSYYEERKKIFSSIKINKSTDEKVKDIAPETKKEKIIDEVNKLRLKKNVLLFTNNQYEVFFAESSEIPNILREIGRLREITFRLIGEGSNNALDLDKFDEHYQHLFLWDNETEKIVGAYRMVLGQKIYPKLGIKGFYTSSLFNFDKEIHPFFRKTIEMGRAFIIPEYQQKPMPLFHLWKGIVHVCLRNPDHKYLMGGVSISDKFSDFSKSLMIEFMRSHYYDAFVAQFVHSKNEFKVKLKDFEKEMFLDYLDKDLTKFDKIIDEIEPNLRLPVLLKKYFKQNAKVIAFNVDPKFNDAIDGLMYIRISELPEDTMKPVMDEMQKELDDENE